ncbi:hypothetical protein A2526_04200 [candidate division WOR-1 bacterium RIFOXYD2_FULL_36_8]|uniref:Polymerase/histidinol phosphatase N-terminal domain-containing protein n=1 Tax=candidate division WOR-1 bacterium RIFOXYB2_FULL_36_35 TaxID=1802578 RepID=A0A1F4S151_UNCSA|nr:MAG: hypothetical protein A2230_03475 [candidate division WOR-1 bacterium RIFOXYA2_FULL_36_21]OGC14158.1 MAG: hypothetical protein A2290_00585 [candidate division WOR-1 bacterium RIFOXYB2_FULL_36_35]OGC15380.1 MAG: hypothetical protein A2282_01575 [candidate division WOR-1 bacterium RIFOXYA12_FULL_36_13]OGC40079.1 MAG: hypothetical protein A2526_04200 [candidate division WOR-1 bacterium RIFOXYD2_FULL_36_8]
MPADLHIHTNLSDGTDSPEDVVKLAKASGLTSIAITDHDTVAGVLRAVEEGDKIGVDIIPGIEFTTEIPKTEVHILGYFFDINDYSLLNLLSKIQQGRRDRICTMVEKLNALGLKIASEDVFNLAGNDSPGRPHVARILIKNAAVLNFKEAFDRYIGFNGPAYVSHYKLTPVDTIKVIVDAGGVAVFAHPGLSNCDNIIPELISVGLRGLEVFYPSHKAEQVERYKAIAQKEGLLVTGGTDFHGSNSGRQISLGGITVPDETVLKLRGLSEYLRRN